MVLSDMSPKTTGVAAADVARSLELARHAVRLALTDSQLTELTMSESSVANCAIADECNISGDLWMQFEMQPFLHSAVPMLIA